MTESDEEPQMGFVGEKQAIEHQLASYDQLIESLQQVVKRLEAVHEAKDIYSLKQVTTKSLAYYQGRRQMLAAYYNTMS